MPWNSRRWVAALVGEPASGSVDHFGSVGTFSLPNSGVRVGVSTKYIDLGTLLDADAGRGVEALEPDVAVPQTLEDETGRPGQRRGVAAHPPGEAGAAGLSRCPLSPGDASSGCCMRPPRGSSPPPAPSPAGGRGLPGPHSRSSGLETDSGPRRASARRSGGGRLGPGVSGAGLELGSAGRRDADASVGVTRAQGEAMADALAGLSPVKRKKEPRENSRGSLYAFGGEKCRSSLAVHALELEQVLIAVHGGLLVPGEQLAGAVGELAGSDGCTGPRSSGTPDNRRQAPWNPG